MKTLGPVAAIIPTWNRAAIVGAAVRSALEQEPPPVELIVVDDGSTDDTTERLRVFGDRVVVRSQENSGPSAARNTGIAHTTAPVVAFLDSDDTLLPGALAAGLAAIDDGADAALWSARDATSGRILTKPLPGERHTLGGLLGADEGFALPCGVFRREVLDAVGGFDVGLRIGEDYLLLLEALACGFDVRLLREPHFVKHNDADPARLSATVEGNMRGKLAALDRFAERRPDAARAHRTRLRRLRSRYRVRLARALAVRPDGRREAAACLGAAFRDAPLRLDVLAEWCAARIAPSAYGQRRHTRQKRRQRIRPDEPAPRDFR